MFNVYPAIQRIVIENEGSLAPQINEKNQTEIKRKEKIINIIIMDHGFQFLSKQFFLFLFHLKWEYNIIFGRPK